LSDNATNPVPDPPVRERPAPPEAPGADGEFRRLDPRTVTVSRLGGAITVTIIAGVSLVGLVIGLFASGPSYAKVLLALGAWLLVTAGMVVLVLAWPPLAYRHASYCVDSIGIRIRRGVVWRSEVAVPRSRVQHTDVSQGPIERGFGLATLVLHTAGTEHESVSLGGLERETAFSIRDNLLRSDADDAV
jgi:membrane protein YdbS with pleckstrin-like domain